MNGAAPEFDCRATSVVNCCGGTKQREWSV